MICHGREHRRCYADTRVLREALTNISIIVPWSNIPLMRLGDGAVDVLIGESKQLPILHTGLRTRDGSVRCRH